jgi:hypothetical protein
MVPRLCERQHGVQPIGPRAHASDHCDEPWQEMLADAIISGGSDDCYDPELAPMLVAIGSNHVTSDNDRPTLGLGARVGAMQVICELTALVVARPSRP